MTVLTCTNAIRYHQFMIDSKRDILRLLSELTRAVLLACGTELGAAEGAPQALVADDILYGADAIAAFLFGDDAKHRRKVYHLAATNGLPTFNLGAIVCARKSTLLEWIKAQEAGGVEATET